MTPDHPEQMIDALSAPLGDLIAEVGRSVAEAQMAMDAGTIANVLALATASGPDDPNRLLRQIGYQPTWYQIPEVTAEITVALTLTGSDQSSNRSSGASRMRMLAAPVDASYASRFNYELKAASSLKFRIVPVPPSPGAERMRVVPTLVGLSLAEARSPPRRGRRPLAARRRDGRPRGRHRGRQPDPRRRRDRGHRRRPRRLLTRRSRLTGT
jgi:hypothetical protein